MRGYVSNSRMGTSKYILVLTGSSKYTPGFHLGTDLSLSSNSSLCNGSEVYDFLNFIFEMVPSFSTINEISQ